MQCSSYLTCVQETPASWSPPWSPSWTRWASLHRGTNVAFCASCVTSLFCLPQMSSWGSSVAKIGSVFFLLCWTCSSRQLQWCVSFFKCLKNHLPPRDFITPHWNSQTSSMLSEKLSPLILRLVDAHWNTWDKSTVEQLLSGWKILESFVFFSWGHFCSPSTSKDLFSSFVNDQDQVVKACHPFSTLGQCCSYKKMLALSLDSSIAGN